MKYFKLCQVRPDGSEKKIKTFLDERAARDKKYKLEYKHSSNVYKLHVIEQLELF